MKLKSISAALTGLLFLGFAASASAQFFTEVDCYVRPTWSSDYIVEPILSSGDQVPRTSNASEMFQMVGIPDGLGAYGMRGGLTALNCNHEMGYNKESEPLIGGDLIRGAFVSTYILRNQDRAVMSADLAYTQVYQDTTLVGEIASTANSTRAFSRLCSGYQGGRVNGFDRYIYFAGEEDGSAFGPNMFSPLGSQAIAVFDGVACALSGMGHFPKENAVVRPYTGRGGYRNKVVILLFEDGSNSDPWSGVFLYVGERNLRSQNPDPVGKALERNGLVGGDLYYLRSTDAGKNSEATLNGEGTATTCEWVLAPNASTQPELGAGSIKEEMVANNYFRFSRTEDGHYNPRNPNQWIFVTTGEGDQGNDLGRLYELQLNPKNPTDNCNLILRYDANSTTIANDGPLAPDNVTIDNRGYVFVQEDGTSTSRPEYNNRNRNSGIWEFNLRRPFSEREQIVEQTDIGRDNILAHRGVGTTVGSQTGFEITQRGLWETSGIISHRFNIRGRGVWGYLGAVQAHGPTSAPGSNTVEDGQLFFMKSSRR